MECARVNTPKIYSSGYQEWKVVNKLWLGVVRMRNHIRQWWIIAKLLCAIAWKANSKPKELVALDIRFSHVMSVCLPWDDYISRPRSAWELPCSLVWWVKYGQKSHVSLLGETLRANLQFIMLLFSLFRRKTLLQIEATPSFRRGVKIMNRVGADPWWTHSIRNKPFQVEIIDILSLSLCIIWSSDP